MTGLWRFELPASPVAEALQSSRGVSATNVDQTVDRDGVAVTVSRIEKGESGARIFYTVRSSHPYAIEPVGPGLQLRLSDGTTLMPRKVEPTTDADWSKSAIGVVELVAEFDVVPATGDQVTISTDPYLTNSDSGGSATISDPLGNWSTSQFAVNGEQFAVTSVDYDDRTDLLGIEIVNLEPIDQADVLFFGLDDGESTQLRVIDQNGQEYELVNASTGMRRDENLDLGAGTCTFTVKVPPDANPSELVITAERCGLLLRGPWTFAVEIS